MLDNSFTLFNVSVPAIEVHNSALVMCGCLANLGNREGRLYSEFEELCFVYLNDNMGQNAFEIELQFNNNQKKSYQKFWARCISVRTNNGVRIKINGDAQNGFTTVNEHNQMVMGIGMFFQIPMTCQD